jgi:hypothetical protein
VEQGFSPAFGGFIFVAALAAEVLLEASGAKAQTRECSAKALLNPKPVFD